jgi:ribulose-5-phosphate 4-epimerase/fuculose-1-phosphate aldolase
MLKHHAPRAVVALSTMLALAAIDPQVARAQTTDPVLNAAIFDVVVANRILYDQGVVDGYGHVSMRHPTNPNLFLLSRSRAPSLVTTADVYVHDLNGNAVNAPPGTTLYLERFIHSEIYRSRPDVNAVVHAHAPSVLPFAGTGIPLKPIFHMSGFLGGGAPVYDIAEFVATPTDMLISSSYLGATLAGVLGAGDIALQRGHGYTATGENVKAAVFRAYYTQVNAALQAQSLTIASAANALGDNRGRRHDEHYDITYLSPAEAAAAKANVEPTMTRPWDLWKAQVIADVK